MSMPPEPRTRDRRPRGPQAGSILRAAFVVVSAFALSSCIGPQVATERDALAPQIRLAESIGAVRCAPQDLAIAESNYDFAGVELDQGHDRRAESHLTLASNATTRAIKNSWPCAPDFDKDGIPDIKDKCPKVPGPKENFGCPWPDRDKDGVLDKDDKCPDVPGPKENHGCPWGDADKDGIPDNIDKCPNDPEDFDGFQDEDGCPELDNDNDNVPDSVDRCPMDPGPASNQGCPIGDRDGDGVPDDIDQCPDVPGLPEFKGCPPPDRDHDGVPDFIDKCPDEPGPISNQGCPEKAPLVVLHKGNIEIKQQVHFKTKKFVILPDSFELLNQVGQVIKDNPKLEIEIDGHTDSQGNDNFNLKLSNNRAGAVRDYLVTKGGVDPGRLTSKGFGETCPVGSNLTDSGRASNRRVEFIITNSGLPHPCAAVSGH